MEKTPTRQKLFCTECGTELRTWDFLQGRALFLWNRPFCDPCRRPVPKDTPLGTPYTGGARRLPRNWRLL